MTPKADEFRRELEAMLREARTIGLSHAGIRARDLYRRTAGPPKGGGHAMPNCCSVMKQKMRELGSDSRVLDGPPKGQGPTLTILFSLPR